MSRKTDRRHALKLTFQIGFHDQFNPAAATERYFGAFMRETDDPGDVDRAFVEREVSGVTAHLGEIDEIIGRFSDEWEVSRLSKADLAIMRLAVYEMRFSNGEVPPGVAINEAVELAKTFSGDEAPPFINGVLGRVFDDGQTSGNV